MVTKIDVDDIISRRKYVVFDDPSLLGAETDISNSLISAKYSSGMDMATQLTLEIVDPNFEFTKNNYFQITRDVYFQTNIIDNIESTLQSTAPPGVARMLWERHEVAAVSCRQGPGTSPIWTVECRSKAVQQMRRDRTPQSITGNSQNYVIQAAKKYGLGTVAETTSKSKTINKATSDRRSDSVWDVIKNLASESKFVAFESSGILFFASQKWLLGRWGERTASIPALVLLASGAPGGGPYNVIPARFPSLPSDSLQLLELPTMRRSDNSPLAVEGTMKVGYAVGSILRPGMTVYLTGYPTFEGMYLISQVDYNILTNEGVNVSIRSIERQEKDILDFTIGKSYTSTFISKGY